MLASVGMSLRMFQDFPERARRGGKEEYGQ